MKVDTITTDPPIKIGIIGGGQLGKMMTHEAKKLGFHVTILDHTQNCPAGQVADEQIVAEWKDADAIKKLASKVDVVTCDVEHVNVDVLKELEHKGYIVRPSGHVLEIIQDKLKQKEVLSKAGIPVPKYKKVNCVDEDVKEFGYPVVQKACKGGYDGRGVFIIKSKNDIKNSIQAESMVEEYIDFEKELAVMVAINPDDEIKCFPVVEMVFNPRANICDMVIAPARIKDELHEKAKQIGVECVKALGGIGVFGIEMFLTKDDEILVNEIAPRPHNSGHYTIECCVTSQFEQHIRAITNLPLGSTELLTPGVMMNLLGEEGHKGPVVLTGVKEALIIPGLSLHFYGKKITKPFRKMGHITVTDKNIEKAIEKAKKAKSLLRVRSKQK
ncbi:MAG: 5-(carboxyamino)imidazole ribonucleotide synthase [Candidatus Thermoplasmatota archaeon]|nr:5-(carboxyamino)imidazole ribonucleotide synthase [Candidatus Thermoplasmatota archaeon]